MGISFSALEMPISAPGADQVLKLLETLDRKGQAVVEKLGAMQKVGGLFLPERFAKPIEDAGEKAKHSAVNLEHLGVKAAFAGAALAQGAEGGVKPFAHQLAMLGGTFGPISLAVTTFVAVAGEALISWMMSGQEEAEKLEKQIVSLERKLGSGGDIVATAKELQALFSGDKYREGDDAFSKAIRSGGILAVKKQIEGLNAAIAAPGPSRKRKPGDIVADATVAGRNVDQMKKDLEVAEATLKQLTEAHERTQKIYDEQVKIFGGTEGAKAKIEADKKAADERKAFHDDTVDEELQRQNDRNRLIREAYERESAEALRILEDGWEAEKKAREAHDKAVVQQARELASDIGSAMQDVLDGFAKGGVGGGLEALKDSVLDGLGKILVGVGTAMIAASPWLKAAAASLLSLSGGGALAAGLGLVALGATLSAASHGGGGGGGSGNGGFFAPGGNLGPQLAAGGGSYSAPNMAGVSPARAVQVNAMFFGKYDPKAGRELLEMIEYHQRRKT